jgi:hypothetical protein
MIAIGATVAFRLRPQSGAHRLFIAPTRRGAQGGERSLKRSPGATGVRAIAAIPFRPRTYPSPPETEIRTKRVPEWYVSVV